MIGGKQLGLDLGSIHRHLAQAHQACSLAQPQHLNEHPSQCGQVTPTQIADPAVVRLPVAGQHPEGQVLVEGSLDLAGRDDAHAVGVEQQHRQPLRGRLRLHARVEPLLSAGILGLGGKQDLGEIQLVHQVQQEIHLVVL